MSESWPGWIRAVWPDQKLALIRNENMNREVRLGYKWISGRISLNAHCQVEELPDGTVKARID